MQWDFKRSANYSNNKLIVQSNLIKGTKKIVSSILVKKIELSNRTKNDCYIASFQKKTVTVKESQK